MTGEDNALNGADDAALFDAVTNGEAPSQEEAQPVVAQPEPVVQETPPVQAQMQERETPRVPLHELIEERKARQALAQELAELRGMVRASQPKPEPQPEPDIWTAPDAFVRAQVAPEINRQQQALLYNARLVAEARFGEERVREAQETFDRLAAERSIHPAEYARIMDSPNPFAEAVKWHATHKIASEVGGDLTAYEAKLKAKLLADANFRQEAMQAWQQQASAAPARPGAPPVRLPSLARVGSSALPPRADAATNDEDLWASLTSSR